MTIKRILCLERVRRIPAQFSWVDHRLVQDRHIEHCDAHAAALYLFLVTVADAQGLSYYSDASLAQRLSLTGGRLEQGRNDLIRTGLIAYERPLYPILALGPPMPTAVRSSAQEIPARLVQLHEALRKRSS